MTRFVAAALALSCVCIPPCGAQNATDSVLATTLTAVLDDLRSTADARINGAVAFDPRIVRAPMVRAPASWPDSLMPQWLGNVRDSAFTTQRVTSLINEMNTPQSQAGWMACGTSAGSKRCSLAEFPAVIAVSEPWVRGNEAQILVYVRYLSTIDAHPYAFFVNVAQLRLIDGRWTPVRWYNRAGT